MVVYGFHHGAVVSAMAQALSQKSCHIHRKHVDPVGDTRAT